MEECFTNGEHPFFLNPTLAFSPLFYAFCRSALGIIKNLVSSYYISFTYPGDPRGSGWFGKLTGRARISKIHQHPSSIIFFRLLLFPTRTVFLDLHLVHLNLFITPFSMLAILCYHVRTTNAQSKRGHLLLELCLFFYCILTVTT